MKLDGWQRVDRGVRGLAPLMITLALTYISVLPLRVPGLTPVTPVVTLIAVYYWSIYRPDLLPLVATFVIGIMQDTLSGAPLGLSSLILLLVQGVVISQRRFFHGKTFLVEWWGFILVAPVALLITWLLGSLYHGVFVAPRPLGFQLLLTIALYPALTWLFARMQHYLLRPA